MANTIYTLKTPLVSTDTSLPILTRDALLDGIENDGVRFIFDLAFGFCYPGGSITDREAPADPLDNALIADISETNDASFLLGAGELVQFLGNGFDYSSLTQPNSAIIAPADILADIMADFEGSSQDYMLVTYVKLPTESDWTTSGLTSYISAANTGGSLSSDFVAFGAHTDVGVPVIRAIRTIYDQSTEEYSGEYTEIEVNANEFGQFAQIAFWRNSSGRGISIRTVNGRRTNTGVYGENTDHDFSGYTLKFGCKGGYWHTDFINQLGAHNFRQYRGFVENLARSGRDPLTVLEADWERTVARNVFS